ncbi:hypothetical protein JXQ70_10490 [bacterium]|nr:hypothetical protein [bacterium]
MTVMGQTQRTSKSPESVLGIHAFTHDSAAAIALDGSLNAYAEQERFSRIKGDGAFPEEAIRFCMKCAGVTPSEIGRVIVPFRPRRGAWSRLRYRLRYPSGLITVGGDLVRKGMRLSLIGRSLRAMDIMVKPEYVDHYYCHALTVFLSSGFEEAVVLVMDGVAEAWTGAVYHAHRHEQHGLSLDCLHKFVFPHSLGLVYAAVTEHLGLQHNRDEGSVMALAAFGDQRYQTDFEELCTCSGRKFRVRQEYFDFGGLWTTHSFARRFFPRKEAGTDYHAADFALAWAVQNAVERICCALAREYLHRTGCPRLCFTGGLALNPVLNGVLLHETGCDQFYVMPAGGDAGTVVGACLLPFPKSQWRLEHAFWGPDFPPARIESLVTTAPGHIIGRGQDSIRMAAELLAQGKIGGRFTGKSEMGPRALGHRSILADPRSVDLRQKLNDTIKHRAPFRPFAPVLIKDRVPELAHRIVDSPFMLLTFQIPETICQRIPAVIHVDGSARIQTVTEHDQTGLFPLLLEFETLTGLPILLNTSLNDQNEPLVNSPEDALALFKKGGLDFMLFEDILVHRHSSINS